VKDLLIKFLNKIYFTLSDMMSMGKPKETSFLRGDFTHTAEVFVSL